MSLDVYLLGDAQPVERIYIREDGATIEISREEWNRRFPGYEPVTFVDNSGYVYSRNITHNLNKMAQEAGIYEYLWRPETIGIVKAGELIEPLTVGLKRLLDDPDRFRRYNPSNGWGSYEGLVDFVSDYLQACQQHPEAYVEVSA